MDSRWWSRKILRSRPINGLRNRQPLSNTGLIDGPAVSGRDPHGRTFALSDGMAGMFERSTVTGRYWTRAGLHEGLWPFELRDGAEGMPVFAPWDPSAQIPTQKYGVTWVSIVCCGPGAHLSERAA